MKDKQRSGEQRAGKVKEKSECAFGLQTSEGFVFGFTSCYDCISISFNGSINITSSIQQAELKVMTKIEEEANIMSIDIKKQSLDMFFHQVKV